MISIQQSEGEWQVKQRATNKTDNAKYEEMLSYEKGKELMAGVGNMVMEIETQLGDSCHGRVYFTLFFCILYGFIQ